MPLARLWLPSRFTYYIGVCTSRTFTNYCTATDMRLRVSETKLDLQILRIQLRSKSNVPSVNRRFFLLTTPLTYLAAMFIWLGTEVLPERNARKQCYVCTAGGSTVDHSSIQLHWSLTIKSQPRISLLSANSKSFDINRYIYHRQLHFITKRGVVWWQLWYNLISFGNFSKHLISIQPHVAYEL